MLSCDRPPRGRASWVGGRRAAAWLETFQCGGAGPTVRGPRIGLTVIVDIRLSRLAGRTFGQSVSQFGLSGFCGFDFILDDGGTAHLLELNPRVTPTCHLLVEGDHQSLRTLALFPPETVAADDPTPLDLPGRAPSLLRRGEEMAVRQHRPVARMARRLKQKVATPRY